MADAVGELVEPHDFVVHCLDEAKQILDHRSKTEHDQARLRAILFRTRQDLGRDPYLVISEAADCPGESCWH